MISPEPITAKDAVLFYGMLCLAVHSEDPISFGLLCGIPTLEDTAAYEFLVNLQSLTGRRFDTIEDLWVWLLESKMELEEKLPNGGKEPIITKAQQSSYKSAEQAYENRIQSGEPE